MYENINSLSEPNKKTCTNWHLKEVRRSENSQTRAVCQNIVMYAHLARKKYIFESAFFFFKNMYIGSGWTASVNLSLMNDTMPRLLRVYNNRDQLLHIDFSSKANSIYLPWGGSSKIYGMLLNCSKPGPNNHCFWLMITVVELH